MTGYFRLVRRPADGKYGLAAAVGEALVVRFDVAIVVLADEVE